MRRTTTLTTALLTLCSVATGAWGDALSRSRDATRSGMPWPPSDALPPSPVLKTGQVDCFDNLGAPVDCEGTGQDGEVQSGLAASPRFRDNGDGTVTDLLSGLTWLQVANCYGWWSWTEALSIVSRLADGECSLRDGSAAGDWRLPNVKELLSLLDYGHQFPALPPDNPFAMRGSMYHWSSSTDVGNPSAAWVIRSAYGEARPDDKRSIGGIWPVRVLREPPMPSLAGRTFDGRRFPSEVSATGQSECWDERGEVVDCAGSGQDGEHRAGSSVTPRFLDNGDGTTTDRLSGLTWFIEADCFGSRTWEQALGDARSLASGACGLEDGSVAGEWRIPNVKELQSLVDFGRSDPAMPSDHPFRLATGTRAWSSTSNGTRAWTVEIGSGSIDFKASKGDVHAVLPVRGGYDVRRVGAPPHSPRPPTATAGRSGRFGRAH
jgi:hypothetical protein